MFESIKAQWLNKKVISISNGFQVNPEDKSLSIGVIVDIVPISRAQSPAPIVFFEQGDGTFSKMLCFSTLLEFDQALYNLLSKMTAKERWLLIQSFIYRFNPQEEK